MNRLFTSTSLVGVALLAVVALAFPLATRAQDATPVASGARRNERWALGRRFPESTDRSS